MPGAARKTAPRGKPETADAGSPWSSLVRREDQVARAALLGLAADAVDRAPRRDAPGALETVNLGDLLAPGRKIAWQVLDGISIGTL